MERFIDEGQTFKDALLKAGYFKVNFKQKID